MAIFEPIKLDPRQGTCKVWEYQTAGGGTSSLTLGTDTINTKGIPCGGAREVVMQVSNVASGVGVVGLEGTLDPDQSEYEPLTDALSASLVAINVATEVEKIVEVLQPVLFCRPTLDTSTSGTCTIRVMVIW